MTATASTATASTTLAEGRKPQPFCSGTGQATANGACAACGKAVKSNAKGNAPRHQAAKDERPVPTEGEYVAAHEEALAMNAPAKPAKAKAADKAQGKTFDNLPVPAAAPAAPTGQDEAEKAPRYRAPIVKAGSGTEATFRKVRANGTTRNIPTYPKGTAARDTAEAMASAREAGATVATVAAEFHVSVPTVRRMLASLDLTLQQERLAAAAAKAASTRKAKAAK